ncbi:hypothetical protein [Thermopirellula anaerolimosa]
MRLAIFYFLPILPLLPAGACLDALAPTAVVHFSFFDQSGCMGLDSLSAVSYLLIRIQGRTSFHKNDRTFINMTYSFMGQASLPVFPKRLKVGPVPGVRFVPQVAVLDRISPRLGCFG